MTCDENPVIRVFSDERFDAAFCTRPQQVEGVHEVSLDFAAQNDDTRRHHRLQDLQQQLRRCVGPAERQRDHLELRGDGCVAKALVVEKVTINRKSVKHHESRSTREAEVERVGGHSTIL